MLTRRELISSTAATALAATILGCAGKVGAPSAAEKPPQRNLPWFRRGPRVFLLDFQMPDPADQSVPGMPQRFFQNLAPETIVEQLAAAHVNTLLVHAKDNQGNAYYHTKAAHKHSSIGDRDLMAEFSRLCRARGMNLLYYVQLTRERRSFEHEDRRARDAKGEPVVIARDRPLLPSREEAPVVCLNGPHRHYIKDILAELSGGYDFDGFWLDCFAWWGRVNPCYCDSCQRSYRNDAGQAIPKPGAPVEQQHAYVKWRLRLNSRLMHELEDHIRAINPKLTITHNGSGVRPWADWDFTDKDDYVCEEFHYNEGPAELSLTCRQNRALKPDAPFEIEIWRFSNRLGGGPDQTSRGYQVRPTDTLLMEMATTCANGGFPQYYDQVRPDGTLEPRSLERAAPPLAEVAKRQSFTFAGNPNLRPIPYAAVLWSKATESFTDQPTRLLHQDDLLGSVTALNELHVPVSVLTERDVAAGEFHGARVTIIPSAELLSRELIDPLTRFVEAGGGLVVTARTALRTRDERLDNFSLAPLLGLDYSRMTETFYTYLAFHATPPNEQITRDVPLDFPISVYESLQTVTKPRAGTDVLANIVTPMRGFHMGFPPDQPTDIPAVTTRRHGSGHVVYCAAPLGALYKRFNHADYRRLLVNVTKWAAGAAPPISVDAPETVEVVAWHDEASRRTIVHVVNRTGAGLGQGPGQLMHGAIPIHDIVLRLSPDLAPGRKGFLEPGHRRLSTSRDGDSLRVTLPPVRVWETVVAH